MTAFLAEVNTKNLKELARQIDDSDSEIELSEGTVDGVKIKFIKDNVNEEIKKLNGLKTPEIKLHN